MPQKHILFVLGTRPEAIKLAPLILASYKRESDFKVTVCITGQHKEMLNQVLSFFDIVPDIDLGLMRTNQSLSDLTADAISSIAKVLTNVKPDVCVVQGDTTTVLAATIACFYQKIRVAHVEAGLRTHNLFSPFPEEANRKLTGHLAYYHFAPTLQSKVNLEREGISENVFVTGNTVIDALFATLAIIEKKGEEPYQNRFSFLKPDFKTILVTGHRRESFGAPFLQICEAIKFLANNEQVQIVYPVHLNPNVQAAVNEVLMNVENVHLIEPLSYPYLVWLMNRSDFILTDSGGIQEEAPSLGKPVLVMRDFTEREEGITSGNSVLVGTDKDLIIKHAQLLLKDEPVYQRMSNASNPYGDGHSSARILDILSR
ncbi:MAG: UDP-N-acetylglucosamine 2-epimerase (non-hydrolyzing) [Bacteroidota bacterium]